MTLEGAVALFLGEEITAVGDNESQVAGAGLVDARKINFVENAVAQGEPDLAVVMERSSDAGLGAGGPGRRNPRPAGGVTYGRITHENGSLDQRKMLHLILIFGL